MEFLKDVLGEELYSQVAEKLKDNDKVKLANLKTGDYVSRSKYAELEGELTTTKAGLTSLQETVNKYNGGDLDALSNSVKDWETKYNTDTANLKAENEKIRKASIARDAALRMGAHDAVSVLAHVQVDGMEIIQTETGEGLKGLDDAVKKVAETYPHLFKAEGDGEKLPQFAGRTKGSGDGVDGVTKAFMGLNPNMKF